MTSEVGRRLLKMIIAVVSLIVIRLILDTLPMLKASGDSAATNVDESGVIHLVPVSIANAIVDTLIFAVLIWTAAGFNTLIRAQSKRLPEGGLIILLLILTVIVALGYHSYLGVIPPMLGIQIKTYGFFILALGLMPLMGLMIVVFRNLDAITDFIFASAKKAREAAAQRPAAPSVSGTAKAAIPSPIAPLGIVCSKCGSAVVAGAKFCIVCGSTAAVPENPDTICPSCGAKQEQGAKFCEQCGKSL